MNDRFAWQFLHRAGPIMLRRHASLTIEGLENIPRHGPVLVVARHYHHLYDGCALVGSISRPAHIVVGLDWAAKPLVKRAMHALCGAARWPVVLRAGPVAPAGDATSAASAAGRAALRASTAMTMSLLREGRVVIVFPEGYPNIDPGYTPKTGDEFLPFQSGFMRYGRIATHAGVQDVKMVPVGFAYHRTDGNRWDITMRIGVAMTLADADPRAIELDVHRLSA